MGAEKQRETKVPVPVGLAGRKDMSAGIVFAASIVVFSLGGYFLDAMLETRPLCMLLGLALGGIGGFIHLVETVSPGTLFSSRRSDSTKSDSTKSDSTKSDVAKVGEQADDSRPENNSGPENNAQRVEDQSSDEQEQ